MEFSLKVIRYLHYLTYKSPASPTGLWDFANQVDELQEMFLPKLSDWPNWTSRWLATMMGLWPDISFRSWNLASESLFLFIPASGFPAGISLPWSIYGSIVAIYLLGLTNSDWKFCSWPSQSVRIFCSHYSNREFTSACKSLQPFLGNLQLLL